MYTSRAKRLVTPFIPNSPLIFTLELGGKIMQGWLVLKGTIGVSGGTTNGTVMGEGAPARLIDRIKVIATPLAGSRYPGGEIVDATPRALLRSAVFQHSGKLILEQSGSTLGNGAAGTYSIYLAIPLYFADSTLRQVATAALNTDSDAQGTPGGTYGSVQVKVDAANLANCFTGNDRAVDYSGLTVEWIDDRANIVGDTAVLYQEDHEYLIPASVERAQDQAMPQDGTFQNWLILAEQSAQENLSNALFNRIRYASQQGDLEKSWQDIYQSMLDNEFIDPAQAQTGMFFIDWTDGLVQNMQLAGQANWYFSVNNVSGANLDKLRIFTRRLIAPTPAS